SFRSVPIRWASAGRSSSGCRPIRVVSWISMRRRGARGRRAGLAPLPVKWALVLLLFVWAGEGGSAAAEPALLAEAACDPAPGPGKIHCTVRQRPKGGKWTWGDVIVVSAPPFAPPLRTRVAAGDASRSDADGADFALALA